MNIVNENNKIYKYEMFWRKDKKKMTYDSNNVPFPWPKEVASDKAKKWQNKEQFINKYISTTIDLIDNGKFNRYDKFKGCLLCDKKNVTTGYFKVNNIIWEDSLKHYVNKHNIKPSEDFIDFIFRYVPRKNKQTRVIARVNGVDVVKHDKKYLKVDRNQILIMDALMRHGKHKLYVDEKNKNVYRFSEHAGLLDFDNDGLNKILVFANTTRVDENDTDIFLPKNVPDAFDYEYMFHTHPPTPTPGARAIDGVLYEFPSLSDIFHFIDHYNDGETQGSIVMTPEGMYIIRKNIQNDQDIMINEDKFYKDTTSVYEKVQKDAIKKYGTKFEMDEFYEKIVQDSSYIDKVNKTLNKYQLHIDYYPRIKDHNGLYVVDTIYLPVYVIKYKK